MKRVVEDMSSCLGIRTATRLNVEQLLPHPGDQEAECEQTVDDWCETHDHTDDCDLEVLPEVTGVTCKHPDDVVTEEVQTDDDAQCIVKRHDVSLNASSQKRTDAGCPASVEVRNPNESQTK